MTISKACKTLMIREPFYGLFLSTLNKQHTDKVPTMAVGLQGVNTMLYINDTFWNSLTDDEQLAVLQHELMHICFFHLTMGKEFEDHTLANIAMDCEINQSIKGLPEGCVTLAKIQEQISLMAIILNKPNVSVEPRAGTKYYYKLLKEYQLKVTMPGQAGNGEGNDSGEGGDDEGSGNGPGNLDNSQSGDHSGWKDFEDLSDAEKELVKNQIDYQIKETAETVIKNQGKLPGELRGYIEELLAPKPAVFNWKAYFRRLLGNANIYFTKKTLRKQSKRFDENAGLKIKQKQHILVAIDTSGSLSDDELKDFFSEIHHIYKAGAGITIIECDESIGRTYEYKGKADYNVTGGGGTDFAPVVNFYNENRDKYTTLVYFTDGYASLDNFKVMKKMIWIISSNGAQEQEYPGLTVKIPKTNN